MSYKDIIDLSYELLDETVEEYKTYVPHSIDPNVKLFDLRRANRLMEGAIDTHIHPAPDAWATRPFDDIDIAIQATQMGMGAVVLKCHSATTARSAVLVQKVVDQWAKDHDKKPVKVIGGVVLNYPVGGLNAGVVKDTAIFGGKFIWTPNVDAAHHRRLMGQTGGIEMIDDHDRVVPEFGEILKIVAEYDLVLSICHHSIKERLIILDAAQEAGVKRIETVHPTQPPTKMTIDQMKVATSKGCYLGHYCTDFHPPLWSLDETIEMIREVGADHIVLGTDCGNWKMPNPIYAYRKYLGLLLEAGISEADVEKMSKLNAQKLIF